MTHREEQAADLADHYGPDVDMSLAQLVEVANLVEGSARGIGVTLSVSGVTITGQIASGRSHFESIRSSLIAAGSDPDEWPVSIYQTFVDIYKAEEVTKANASSLDLSTRTGPGFIHLSEAAIVNQGSTVDIGTWRGKLSSVDGWTLGFLRSKATD